MSTYDDASLVMIPSGYKTGTVFSQKPMSTDGQLTFTRSNDTATRVGPDGLIEKVRTNEVRNSAMVGASAPSTLPTNWVLTGGGLTWTVVGAGTENGLSYIEINASGTSTGTNSRIGFDSSTQILGATGQYWTNSFYFKKVSESAAPDAYTLAIFENTSAGSLVATKVEIFTPTTNLERYSYSVLTTGGATVARVQPFVRFSLTSGNSYDFTFRVAAPQMEQGDIATQFIPTTSAAVSVGPVANVPRLDYLNTTCPRLLLEPQRTNLLTFSESFDNAAWTKQDATITANNAVSPIGYQDADLYTTSSDTFDFVRQTKAFTSGTAYTLSVFVKAGTSDEVSLTFQSAAFGAAGSNFNLTTLAVTNFGTTVGRIENYGNGWYRCSATATATASVNASVGFSSIVAGAVSTLYLWGAQLEAGAYATSYIPTLGAAVTRGADSASKTGISSLIGSSAGTMYVDLNDFDSPSSAENGDLLSIENTNGALGAILLFINKTNKNLQLFQLPQNTSVTIKSGVNTNQRFKIAIVYNGSSYKAFVNGEQTYAGTLTATTGLSQLKMNPTPSKSSKAKISQVLLFTAPLTDAQALELTTI